MAINSLQRQFQDTTESLQSPVKGAESKKIQLFGRTITVGQIVRIIVLTVGFPSTEVSLIELLDSYFVKLG